MMSGAGVPVGRPDWRTDPATRRESAEFNLGLVIAVAAFVAFWLLVALSLYSLI